IIIAGGLYFSVSGYLMYNQAVKHVPLTEKVLALQSSSSYTKIADINQDFLDAVVAVEDKHFFKHSGIDIQSTLRAVLKNIKMMSFVEGGSSITQQVAKNMYFTQEKKIERKVAELFVVFQLEKLYDKKEILEFYVNMNYYGDGFYGVKNASLGYFGILPSKLNLAQASLLAGLPNAPSAYQLSTGKDMALQRQLEVLNAMLSQGYISQKQMQSVIRN
ncbi:MAG: biosynthetic peptidoglycan transglycosylase, partial [Clostridia bacterium]